MRRNNYQTILPFFSGHFLGLLAGHFLWFVSIITQRIKRSRGALDLYLSSFLFAKLEITHALREKNGDQINPR